MKWILAAHLSLLPAWPLAAEEAAGEPPLRRGLRRDSSRRRNNQNDVPSAGGGRRLVRGENKRKQRKKKEAKERKKRAHERPEGDSAGGSEDARSEATEEALGTSTSSSSTSASMVEDATDEHAAADADAAASADADALDSDAGRMEYLRNSVRSGSPSGSALRVRHVYTYGAPSVVKGPALSGPHGACLPGLRVYTEDREAVTCSWYQFWCTPGERVTNVDFASQINVKEGYPHPKTATLVLRLNDGRAEYTYRPCRNYENKQVYDHQWWPQAHLESDMIPGWNLHDLDDHYERRLRRVPVSVRGPALEYVSVARCVYHSSVEEVRSCLKNYQKETSSRLGGVVPLGWETIAFMSHDTKIGMTGLLNDGDTVVVLANDRESDRRRCLVGFQGSDGVSDLTKFVLRSNEATSYCGRSGVHKGVAGELRGITRNPKWRSEIVPALGTCAEVTCAGHSLGGALCNLFAMCANSDPEKNFVGGGGMREDWESLVWTKKGP